MDVFKMRQATGLRQDQFWPKIGISQSGGSRYENESRKLPRPIQTLLTLRYGTDAQARKLFAELRRK